MSVKARKAGRGLGWGCPRNTYMSVRAWPRDTGSGAGQGTILTPPVPSVPGVVVPMCVSAVSLSVRARDRMVWARVGGTGAGSDQPGCPPDPAL